MNVISIIAGILLFFSSSLIGLWLRKRKTNKAKFYENYYSYLTYTLEKISYERMPVEEIKNTFSAKEPGEFSDFLIGKRHSVT